MDRNSKGEQPAGWRRLLRHQTVRRFLEKTLEPESVHSYNIELQMPQDSFVPSLPTKWKLTQALGKQ